MTYDELEKLRSDDLSDVEKAEDVTCMIEQILESYPFRGMPRSMRFLGAGLGCMEVFCKNGRFFIVRNNGADLGIVLECGDRDEAFLKTVGMIYEGRREPQFADECLNEILGKSN